MPLGPRRRRPRVLVAVLVTMATLLLATSIWMKVHALGDPAWLGAGLVGLGLLVTAVGTSLFSRRP